jgi:nitrite reductase/ring-hydroxylating ferredoxin subunit
MQRIRQQKAGHDAAERRLVEQYGVLGADGLTDLVQVVCPLRQHAFVLTTGCSTTGQPCLTVYPATVDAEGQVTIGGPLRTVA